MKSQDLLFVPYGDPVNLTPFTKIAIYSYQVATVSDTEPGPRI